MHPKVEYHLVCDWDDCGFVSDHVNNFSRHLDDHVPDITESEGECLWSGCTFRSNCQRHLRRHVLFHGFHCKVKCVGDHVVRLRSAPACCRSGAEAALLPDLSSPFRCQWDECGLEFDEPITYFSHSYHHFYICYKDALESKQTAQCKWNDCSFALSSTVVMRSHAIKHTGEKAVACSQCGYMFNHGNVLVQHRSGQIPVSECKFECSWCRKRYATKRLLRLHAVLHAGKTRCPVCDQLCSKSSLQQHLRLVHAERRYSCRFCPRAYKTQRNLNWHVLRKHGEDCDRVHCPFSECTYWHISSGHVNYHVKLVHLKIRNQYACHLCGRMFVMCGFLTQHLKRFHTDDIPQVAGPLRYECDADGVYRLDTEGYRQVGLTPAADSDSSDASGPDSDPSGPDSIVPNVLSLTCADRDPPEFISLDDGRELTLPPDVRNALARAGQVLVCVQNEQVRLLSSTGGFDIKDDPDHGLIMTLDSNHVQMVLGVQASL